MVVDLPPLLLLSFLFQLRFLTSPLLEYVVLFLVLLAPSKAWVFEMGGLLPYKDVAASRTKSTA